MRGFCYIDMGKIFFSFVLMILQLVGVIDWPMVVVGFPFWFGLIIETIYLIWYLYRIDKFEFLSKM